jgi:hypothetical protein
MGTRSLTTFLDEWDNEEIVVMYKQFDGTPRQHGADLADFLKDIEIVNGIGRDNVINKANGIRCLSAQVISHFKDEIGKFYLYKAGTRDVGEQYVYTIYYDKNELKVKVRDLYKKDIMDRIVFNGNLKEMEEWLDKESN